MKAESPTIIVIGAGIGGLSLAQGLTQSGYNVVVYERDQSPSSRAQGYRIAIRSMGMDALKALLPPEKMSRLSETKVADIGDGFICASEQMQPFLTIPQGQDPSVQLLRSELRNLLLEDLNVRWNKRLIKMEEKDDRVIAHFDDGSQATGDLLVGCDGASSTVRKLLEATKSLPSIVELERVVIGGQIDRTPEWEDLFPLNHAGFVRFLDPNSQSISVCFSERVDRSPTIFWAFSEKPGKLPKTLNSHEIAQYSKKWIESASWHENLKKLVNETPEEEIFPPWILRTTQFPDSVHYPIVSSGRITLLGDAAHAMPPDKGLGGNNVLQDAKELAGIINASTKPIDWIALTAEYEEQMFSRARKAVKESEEAAQLFQNLRAQFLKE